MGAAGAVVVAVLFLAFGLVGAALSTLAWWRTRGAAGRALSWSRRLLPTGIVVLVVGLLLPKSILRDLAFETTGRVVLVLASVVGAGCAAAALYRRREKGALPALATHVYFGMAAATPVGEALFGVFQMM